MFFITPQRSEQSTSAATALEPAPKDPTSKRKRIIAEGDHQDLEQVHSYYPKRTSRACDRCRLKKTRCSGGKICERCKQDGVVCVTTSNPRKHDHGKSSEYVQLVESQRDQMVQALHKVLQSNTSTDLARVKVLLADMGISTDNLRQSVNPRSDPPASSTDELSPLTWDEIFDNLDVSQLEAIEFSCVAHPQNQELLSEYSEPTQGNNNPYVDSNFNSTRDSSQIASITVYNSNDEAAQWLSNPSYDHSDDNMSLYTHDELVNHSSHLSGHKPAGNTCFAHHVDSE